MDFFHFNPTTLVGISGVPFIEQIVEYLKDYMRLPAYLAPFAALVVAVILNEGMAYYLHLSLLNGFYAGLVAGFGSSMWHEMATPTTQSK